MKQLIRDCIFEKHYKGIRDWVKYQDIPKDLFPTDEISIQPCESFYSENNSWDAYTMLYVFRDREETDDEYNKRINTENSVKERTRKERYKTYLQLKKEFENE